MLTKEQVMTMWGKAADADPDECLFAVEFARLVWEEAVKQERERIALAMDINAGHPCSNEWGDGYNQACRDIAEGLRSRTAVPAKE